MALTKSSSPTSRNILGDSGLNGKSITGLHVLRHGSVEVVIISYSTGSQYVKFNQGQVEVGGDENWGSGKQVL